MPLNDDIKAFIAAKPDIQPEELYQALGKLRNEKQAKYSQRQKAGVNDPQADEDFFSYDLINESDFKEVLPQAIAFERNKVTRPQAPPAVPGLQMPKAETAGDLMAGRDVSRGLSDNLKVAAEYGAALAPGAIGPGGIGAKALATTLPFLSTMLKRASGSPPQDFSKSAVEGLTGLGVNAASGPVAAGLKRILGSTNKSYSMIDEAVGAAGGALNMAAPGFVSDENGLQSADPGTGDLAFLGMLMGAGGAFGKQVLGNAARKSGTMGLEQVEQGLGLPQGPQRPLGARELQGDTITRGMQQSLQGPANVAAARVRRGAPVPAGINPSVVSDMAGTAADTPVANTVHRALDNLFTGSDEAAKNIAANRMKEVGSTVAALHGGDKNKALQTVVGYFYDKFFRQPGAGGQQPVALEMLQGASGSRRLHDMFVGMGFSADEADKAGGVLIKVAKSLDKINNMEDHAKLGRDSKTRVGISQGGLARLAASAEDLWYGVKPSHVAEGALRGAIPGLRHSPSSTEGLAQFFRGLERNTMNSPRGMTGAQQSLRRLLAPGTSEKRPAAR